MSKPATASVPRHRPDWMVLALLCTAQFMVVLDVSIVNVALPSIRHELGFSQTGLQWIVNAYTIAFAGFLLLGGRAADLFGRRRVFIFGLGVFTAASLAGGLAQDQTTLLAARIVQGLGGAVLSPATLTILTTTFRDGAARSRALGAWSAVAGAGGATGALAGGVLTDLVSWRWIFFINVPIGVAALVATVYLLPESRNESMPRNLDVTGSILVTGGLMALVYGIVNTTSHPWTSVTTVATLAAGVVLLIWFVIHEARVARSPLVPLRLFRSRSLTVANVVMFLVGAAIFASWFFLSLYMQNVLGYSPLQTGLAFLPQTIGIIVGAQISSRLLVRLGPRPLLLVGPTLSAAGLYWLGSLTAHSTYWGDLFVPSVLVTFGMGLTFTPVAFAATAGVAPQEAGLASGVLNTNRQMGGAIGLAALATLATDKTHAVLSALPAHPATGVVGAAVTSGYTKAFHVSVVAALMAAGAAAFLPVVRRSDAPVEATELDVPVLPATAPAVALPGTEPPAWAEGVGEGG